MRPRTAALFGVVLTLSSCTSGAPPPDSVCGDPSPPIVLTGLDVLASEDFARLAGRRVGLVTNHSGIDRKGRHGIDLFVASKQVELVSLFSPEHGIRGTEDTLIHGAVVDAASGLEVHSLYGKTRRPTAEMLARVDTVVFDIQDIGARFYTYIATLGGCMQVAAELGLKVVVLDRPNPLGGDRFEGPIQDDDLVGKFTAFRPMPVTHGMTVGEVARLFNEEFRCDLEVVPMQGWQRGTLFDATGLPWVNPSPNMRSLDEELLYPMVALLESNKDISVGRGTDRPFEYVGAPWIDSDALTQNLRERELPGIWPMKASFVPNAGTTYPHHGKTCHGVRFVVTDRSELWPVEAGLHLLAAMHQLYPKRLGLERLRGLVGAGWVLKSLLAGDPPSDIASRWRLSPGFKTFAAARRRALLY